MFASLLLAHRKDAISILSELVKKIAYKYTDNFTDLITTLTQSFTFDQIPAVLSKIKEDCEKDFFLHPHCETLMKEAQGLVVQVYSKLYSVINVEYVAKISGLAAEAAIEVTQAAVKGSGMRGTLTEDKKNIMITLEDTNMNKEIAEKGKELEERTKKLQDRLQSPAAAQVA